MKVVFIVITLFFAVLVAENLKGNDNKVIAPDTLGLFTPHNADQLKLISDIKKNTLAKRNLSNFIEEKDMMSPEMIAFRDKFITLKRPSEIALELDKLDKNYDKLPLDLKYLTTELLIAKPMRGIVWRMIPLAEKEKITHSVLLTFVKRIASNVRIYFPKDHTEALFAYFTEPYLENGKAPSQFQNSEDFQNFLGNELYPVMYTQARKIESLKITKPLLWDNKLAFGTDAFSDDLDRYKLITEADRYLTIAAINFGMGFIATVWAYNIEGLMSLTKDEGKLFGIDGFASEINGVSSYDRVGVLLEPTYLKTIQKVIGTKPHKYRSKYDKLFTLKSRGKASMVNAYNHLQDAVYFLRVAWDGEIKDRPANELALINPARLQPYVRNIDRALTEVEAMLKGEATLRSRITGEKVVVNLPNYFNNPPEDLKSFLPLNWNIANKEKVSEAGIKIRNYEYGMPSSWNLELYKRYIPSLTTMDSIPKAAKTLNESWGGFLVPIGNLVE